MQFNSLFIRSSR